MSLKQEILKEIKKMLNEDSWYKDPQFTQKQSVEDGKPDRPEQTSIVGGQSKGICPPGQEQTGQGPEGPICSPKSAPAVNKKVVKRGLFDIGSKGPQVKELQKILATQGYDDEFRGNKAGQLTQYELEKFADGIFGAKTMKAVKLFQKDNNLPQTGYVDKKTYEIIKKMGIGKNIASTRTPSEPNPTPKGQSSFGASGAGAPALEESKNWIDKTRESAASSLFERLTKDAANKKVI